MMWVLDGVALPFVLARKEIISCGGLFPSCFWIAVDNTMFNGGRKFIDFLNLTPLNL